MQVIRSRGGVGVRLTDERWQHIARHHPEMGGQRDSMLETLADPDMIQEGDSGELLAIRFWATTPLTSKFLVVAYREIGSSDGFVVAAYLARRPSARRVTLWKR